MRFKVSALFLIRLYLEQLLAVVSSESESVKVLVPQLCPALCNPLDCSSRDSSVHGLLQARILEWVAIPFSRESS